MANSHHRSTEAATVAQTHGDTRASCLLSLRGEYIIAVHLRSSFGVGDAVRQQRWGRPSDGDDRRARSAGGGQGGWCLPACEWPAQVEAQSRMSQPQTETGQQEATSRQGCSRRRQQQQQRRQWWWWRRRQWRRWRWWRRRGDAAAAAAAPPPERPRQQRRQRAPQSTTQAEQRITINFYFWNVLDAPPEEEWGSRDGAIAHCMKALNLPRGSNQVVKEVFTKTSQAAMAGHVYDPATSKNVGGLAKVLLAIDSPEAQIAADELEEGGSRKSATEKVNEYRLTRGLEHVGQGAVYSLMRRLGVDTKRVRKAPQAP